MNFQAIVSIPLPMERKLHSEACTEFKMQSDYFFAELELGRYRSGQLKLFYVKFCGKNLDASREKKEEQQDNLQLI